MRRLCLVAALAAAGLLSACQSVAEAPPQVLAERSATQCPLRQPLAARGLLSIDSAAAWQAQVERSEADVLGAPAAWATARVLVLGLGPLPTGGHSVALVQPLRLASGELQVQARHAAPPADAMVGQAFTAPCLLVVVQRQGWQRARVEWVR
jgi:PrcB C-terminal